jgi:hypothetical protein
MTIVQVGLVVAAFALLPLLPPGCAPAPKNVPCENDADCHALDKGYEYCLEQRCVKCVSRSMCAAEELCIDGECKRR